MNFIVEKQKKMCKSDQLRQQLSQQLLIINTIIMKAISGSGENSNYKDDQ